LAAATGGGRRFLMQHILYIPRCCVPASRDRGGRVWRATSVVRPGYAVGSITPAVLALPRRACASTAISPKNRAYRQTSAPVKLHPSPLPVADTHRASRNPVPHWTHLSLKFSNCHPLPNFDGFTYRAQSPAREFTQRTYVGAAVRALPRCERTRWNHFGLNSLGISITRKQIGIVHLAAACAKCEALGL